MTTPTRPLPPGVEIREFAKGWHAIWDFDESGFFRVSRLDGRKKLCDFSLIDSNQGFDTEADATAAYWAWHDAQPENQPKAQPTTKDGEPIREGEVYFDGNLWAYTVTMVDGDEVYGSTVTDEWRTAPTSRVDWKNLYRHRENVPPVDAQPENQPKGEVPKLLGGTYNESVLLEMIDSITARVAALEAKAAPLPSGFAVRKFEQGWYALDLRSQNKPLYYDVKMDRWDEVHPCSPNPASEVALAGNAGYETEANAYADKAKWLTRAVGTKPPLPSPSAEVQNREPVVGMVYSRKSQPTWWIRINDGGEAQSSHIPGGGWTTCALTTKEVCGHIRSGELVPVPGYKVEGSPQ